MVAVAYATMPVIPSFDGLHAQLEKGIGKPLEDISKRAGESLEKGIKSGVDAAEKDLRRLTAEEKKRADEAVAAERRVEDAKKKVDIQTKELMLKEKQLADMRASGKDTSAKELQVEKARLSLKKATDSLKDEEKKLAEAQNQAASASEKVIAAQKRLDNAMDVSEKKVSRFGKAFDSIKDGTGKAASAIGDFAQKAQLQASIALGGIGMLAKGSMDYAAEAEQSYGAVESIFKEHADTINSASKTAADAVGMSGRAYREQSAYMGAMLKNQGVPMEDLAGKTQELVALGSDLASTFGGPTSDAVEALGAMLRGETDPIERYGVSVKQADIEAKAAAMGLGKLEGEAGKAAKTQALLALITEKTADAQGQFARETDTAAHKQQVATAKIDDAKEAIGTGLLPIYAELADMGAKVAGVIGEHPKLFLALGGAVATAAAAIVGIGSISTAVAALGGMAGIATKLGAAFTFMTGPIGLAIAGIAAVTTALWAFFTKTETGRKMWDQLVDSFKAGWEKISGVFKNIKDAFGELGQIFSGKELETDLNALTKIFGEDMAVSIGNFVIDVRDKFNQVKDAVKEFWGMLKGDEMAEGWPNLADLLGVDNAEKLFDFVGKVREAFGQIKDAGGELFAAFQGKDMGFGALSELFGEEFGKKIADGFAVAGEKVREFWDKITHFDLSSLTTALGPLADFLGDSFKGTWDSLQDSMGSILSIVSELGKSFGGAFFSVLKGVWGLLRGIWDVVGPLLLPALKIIGAVVGGVLIGAFIALAKTLEGVAWGISKLLDGFEWIVQKIAPVIEWVGKLAQAVGERLGQDFTQTKEWIVGAWGAIVEAFNTGKDWVGTALDWIAEKWRVLSDGVKAMWEGYIKPAWDAMLLAGQVLAAVIGTAVLTPIMIGWNNLSTMFKFAWETLIKPAWDAMAAGAQALWQNYLSPAWEGIKSGFQAVGDAFVAVWEGYIKPAFDWVAQGAQALWNDYLVPAYEGIKSGFQAVGDFFMWVWTGLIQPAWDAVASGANWIWQEVLVPAFEGIKQAFQAVGDFFQWVWDAIIQPAWQALGDGIRAVIDGVVLPAWEAMKAGLQAVGDFFQNIVDGIKSVWDSLRSALAKPINFMINTVYNGGIKKAWDTMAGFLPGINPAPAMGGIPEYATGGRIRGKGTGTSDDVLMWGSNGEHMITAKEVERAGGHNAIYFMRDLIASGTPFKWDGGKFIAENRKSVDAFGAAVAREGIGHVSDNGLYSMLPKYKDGGEIRPMWELQLENGHRAAKMRDGHPYTWGFEDCSGYMSAIGDAIINGGDGKWSWATGSFPGGQPFVPGLGAGFSVGVHDNPGGPGGGHTAGTLTGVGPYSTVNVESGGGHGYVAYGGPAAGADSSQFVGVQPGQYHLAIGADGAFEPGGPGGGPSPEKMLSAIMEKIQWVTDKAMSPIKGMLPGKPPEWNQVPTSVWEKGKELVPEGAKAIAGNLGDKLRTVYSALSGVKDLIGDKVHDAGEFVNRQATRALQTVGLYDNGGWLMPGTYAENRSGKPEPIMADWQWQIFKALPPALAGITPALQKMAANTDPNKGGGPGQALRDAFPNVAAVIDHSTWEEWYDMAGKFGLDFFTQFTDGAVDAFKGVEKAHEAQKQAIAQVAEKEGKLEEARRELAEAMEMEVEQSGDWANKIAEAEDDLAQAREDGDPEKIAKAEEKLADVRDKSSADAVKGEEKRADAIQKAQEKVTAAELDLSDARSAVVSAAKAAGFAEINLVLSIIDMIKKIISHIVSAVYGAQEKVAQGMSRMFEAIGKINSMVESQMQLVGKLRQDLINAQFAVAESAWNLRLAQYDQARAQLQGIKTVATAEKALELERKKQSLKAQFDYKDMSLAYDRYRWLQKKGLLDQVGDYLEVTPEIRALEHELNAARINALITQRQAAINVLEATYKQALASLDLMDVQRNLQRATAQLALMSGKTFGYTSESALIGQKISDLYAEQAKLKAQKGQNWWRLFSWHLSGAGRAADQRISQIDEEIARLKQMEDYEEMSPEQQAQIDDVLKRAQWMGFWGGADNIESMIKSSPIGDAQRALEQMELEKKIADIKGQREDTEAAIERMKVDQQYREEIDALKKQVAALQAGANSEQYKADAEREADPAVRDALWALADYEAATAKELASVAKGEKTVVEVVVPERDLYTREDLEVLIDGYFRIQDVEVRVSELEKPQKPSALDVMSARR